MTKPSCTPRERFLAALQRRQADRPAFSWGFGPQPPAKAALDEYLKKWSLNYDQLMLATSDVRRVAAPYCGPSLAQGESVWGYTTKLVSYGDGEYEEYDYKPLENVASVDDILAHRWPDPTAYDYSKIAEAIAETEAGGDYAISIIGANPLETMIFMTGMENTLILMLTEPEVVHAVMRKITDFFLEHIRLALEAGGGRIDFAFCADDVGTQNGPMISRQTYRDMIMPYHKEVADLVHAHGAAVMHHSDGAVAELLDDLIESGVDCLEAVQVECNGMAAAGLKERFGDRLSFQGAVSVQRILPCVSENEVRQEVRRLKQTLGAGGGYICAPSHAIQAGTPCENVIAMVEEAVEKTIDQIAER